MKKLSAQSLIRSRYTFAIVSGLILASAFPNIGIAGFAWIAPALILISALGTSGKRSFRIGYVAGFAHYLASLYWLLCIPVRGFPILGWIALSAFLALFPASWTWLCTRVMSPDNGSLPEISPSIRAALAGWAEKPWFHRFATSLLCAAGWVGIEMIIARIFGGFPWNLLGASQYKMVPLIQISSVVGVYGVSFLLVWISVSLLNAVAAILRAPQERHGWLRDMALPVIVISLVLAFGFHRIRNLPETDRTLSVTLIQPSIPQTMIWDRNDDMVRFEKLLRLSQESLTNRTDLLIWPEAAIPRLLRYEKEIYEAVTTLARSNQVWMIVGADDADRRQGAVKPNDVEYYNASFLISPEGVLAGRYRKRSLVMFGEYIPLERWLPFIKWFTPVTGSFTPGDKAVPFVMRPGTTNVSEQTASKVKTSVLICFEDNFPHLVREYVEPDTDFLVNITNNGWFGESAAQWQHAANSIFRAIETGTPLIRCSNNGLTCWVDEAGRIRDILRDAKGTVYGPGGMTISVPLLGQDGVRPATFYLRHGDWFGWSCLGVAFLQCVPHLRRRKALVHPLQP